MLKFFDIIGPDPALNIFGKKYYKTMLGGLLSITLVIMSILTFFGFGLDLLYRQNPIAFMSREFITNPRIDEKDTFFALAPLKPYSGRIKDINSKLDIYMEYLSQNVSSPDPEMKSIRVDLVPCMNSSKATTYNLTSVQLTDYSDYYCLPDNFNSSLYGKYGSNEIGLYVFRIGYK